MFTEPITRRSFATFIGLTAIAPKFNKIGGPLPLPPPLPVDNIEVKPYRHPLLDIDLEKICKEFPELSQFKDIKKDIANERCCPLTVVVINITNGQFDVLRTGKVLTKIKEFGFIFDFVYALPGLGPKDIQVVCLPLQPLLFCGAPA